MAVVLTSLLPILYRLSAQVTITNLILPRLSLLAQCCYLPHLRSSLHAPLWCLFSLFSIVLLHKSPSPTCFNLGRCCSHHALTCFPYCTSSLVEPHCYLIMRKYANEHHNVFIVLDCVRHGFNLLYLLIDNFIFSVYHTVYSQNN